MGVARISFKDDCAVMVGGQPDGPDKAILNPRPVGRTNTPFIIADGLHCFSLDEACMPFAPRWQIGQVSPGNVLKLSFS
jgi:hypothetical protein